MKTPAVLARGVRRAHRAAAGTAALVGGDPLSAALTDDQIRELRCTAELARDWFQAAVCDMALGMEYFGRRPSEGYRRLDPAERSRLDDMTMTCARDACARAVRRRLVGRQRS